MFLAGLAMAANPTKETVGYVLELCEENPGRTAMLTLGTLIHKVCESSPEECNDEVRFLIIIIIIIIIMMMMMMMMTMTIFVDF